MIAFMNKKPTKLKKANRQGTPISVWIDSELMEVFERYCANNRRTKTAEIEMAIESTLRNAGMWPPKPVQDAR